MEAAEAGCRNRARARRLLAFIHRYFSKPDNFADEIESGRYDIVVALLVIALFYFIFKVTQELLPSNNKQRRGNKKRAKSSGKAGSRGR